MTSMRRQVLHPEARERAVRQVRRHAWEKPAFSKGTVKGLFSDFAHRLADMDLGRGSLVLTAGLTMKDDPDRVVGYKERKGHLYCLTETTVPIGSTEITAEDLEYGGTCFRCGRDLLA